MAFAKMCSRFALPKSRARASGAHHDKQNRYRLRFFLRQRRNIFDDRLILNPQSLTPDP
jgi:hypothetical protein